MAPEAEPEYNTTDRRFRKRVLKMTRRLILAVVLLLTLPALARAQTECGGEGQACCRSGPPCSSNLTCTVLGTCQCGGQGQACCGDGHQCGANLTCAEGTCQCGGEGQACCEKTSGGVR